MSYSPKQTAKLLDIAPATLRRWSIEFADVLSDSAHQAFMMNDSALPWRYTEADIAILQQVKELLKRGGTYDEIHLQLTDRQIDNQSLDQLAIGAPVQMRPISENSAAVPTMPQPSDEPTIANEEKVAANEQVLEVQQCQADVRDDELQTSQGLPLLVPMDPRRSEARYRLLFRLVITAVGFSIVLVISMLIMSSSKGQSASVSRGILANSTDLVSQQTVAVVSHVTVSPLLATPTTPEPAPAATAVAPTTGPPSATVSPLLATPTAPEPAPAATAVAPTTGPPSALVVLQRVSAAEAALRTGQFEVVIDYGNGSRSSAHIRFDLGDRQRAPRYHMITRYESQGGSQTSEKIAIGDRSWQRQPDGTWSTTVEQEGAWGQTQGFLPHASLVARADTDSTNEGTLRWYDAGRDADLTLRVDPDTGVPHELRHVTRATKTVLIVTYSGWNTPVEIVPPNPA